jgi:CrcB protein
MAFVVIGLGGILGANARYLISVWAADRYGVAFPYGTFLINVTGSALMGLAATLIAAQFTATPEAGWFFTTGFLGAYTTFSTFTYETIALLREAEVKLALINVLGSAGAGIVGCVSGVAVGTIVASWLA